MGNKTDTLFFSHTRKQSCVFALISVAAVLLVLIGNSSDNMQSFASTSVALRKHANSNKASSKSSGDAVTLNDFCKRQYKVSTWDGKAVPVCDPSLCDAKPPVMKAPPKDSPAALRRWTADNDAAYPITSADVDGWLVDNQLHYVKAFSTLQHSLGIYGAVGEIGVHHGKFFVPLAGNAAVSEPLVAIDLFDAQTENYDQSGSGSILYPEKLMSLLDKTGIPRDDVMLVSGNSLTLTAANFTVERNLPAWRMLSVDGGHSLETTLHDINVAACTVRDGGIVIVDDWFNQQWTGVQEAVIHAAHGIARLVPFMHGQNKIWFTTLSHVSEYVEVAKREFGCVGMHESRSNIGGINMCLTSDKIIKTIV